MTTPIASTIPALDFAAVDRWPARAAAHTLGAGLLLAVIAALPVAPSDLDRHQLPKETLVHLATWIAVLLARPHSLRGLRPDVVWSLVVLLLLTLVSGIFATNGWLALRAGSLIFTGAAAFLTAHDLAQRGMAPILLAWCASAGIAGTATGLAQAYGIESPFFALTRLPGGTFGNRNFLAHFAAITLPILVLAALSVRRNVTAIATSLGCAILVAAIVISRSRAAWLATGVGMSVLAIVYLRGWRRQVLPTLGLRATILAITILLGVIGAIMIPNELSWRSTSPYSDTLAGLTKHDDGSGRGRILQYSNTMRLALRHPLLGVGPGNWPVRYADVAPPGDPTWVFGDVVPINPWPSSDWAALLSEIGIGATLMALLLGLSLAWRGWQATGTTSNRVLAGGALLAVLSVTFIEGNLDAVLLLPAPILLVAIAVGALLQMSDGRGASDFAPSASMPRIAQLLPLVLGIVTLRSILQTSAYLVAGSGRSTPRMIWAARIDPGSYPIRIALAQRESCVDARGDVLAVVRMAPNWPATINAARRCGVKIQR